MSMPSDTGRILEFIDVAKSKGIDDTSLVALLRQNGWSERRVYTALSLYYEERLGMKLPVRGGRAENARDAFLYLLTFATLGIWTVALVWLGDILVDHVFPSSLDTTYDMLFRESVAGQLASLIIAFPIFFWVSRIISREIVERPEALESGVRKWLTYIALVLTAVTLLSDAVWFLQQFLSGDLTMRFVVKTAILFFVAGGTFWYYLGTVRTTAPDPARDRAFGIAAIVVVAAAVVVGFTGIGSPAHERAVSLDDRRVSDLQQLATSIQSWYDRKHALPHDLTSVAVASQRTDPSTSEPYRYLPLTATTYRLCASFSTATHGESTHFWQHPASSTCFTLDVKHPIPTTDE